MKILSSLLIAGSAVLAVAQDRPPIKFDAAQIAEISARMNKLTSKHWQDGFAFGQELAELPSPLGYQILRDNWNKGASLEARKQMFKGFVFNKHPDTLLVLNIGMHDPSLSMQAWSMTYLRSEFLMDFSSNFAAYPAWFEKVKALSVAKIKEQSVTMTLDAVTSASAPDLDGLASGAAGSLGDVAVGAYPRLGRLLDRLIDAPAPAPGCVRLAGVLLANGGLPQDEKVARALRLFDRKETLEDYEPLGRLLKLRDPRLVDRGMKAVEDKVSAGTPGVYGLAQPLLESEDPRVIPFLIDQMEKAKPDVARELGMCLGNSLGVSGGDGGKADFWKSWYAHNRVRFETKFDEKALPSFKVDAVPTMEYIPDAEDVKDIPSAAFLVGNDPMKRYFVSGKLERGKTKKVLVVMPGGPGTPDFHPFVKRIQKNVLDDGWIVVQPIAPKWSEDEDRVVWPSEGVPYAPAKFTMETFLDGLLDDLQTRHGLKVEKTYMLGWSSSGPPIYSYAAHGKHPIDGAFVAMSIFQPTFFGDARSLMVKRFYLLHSPQDFIKMDHPRSAKAALEGLHVPVVLDTYEGGHGWHGPVFQMIQTGLQNLGAL